MVTKEPKSEKTTGRASTKKAVAAQPESTLVEGETTAKTKAKATTKAAKSATKDDTTTPKAAAKLTNKATEATDTITNLTVDESADVTAAVVTSAAPVVETCSTKTPCSQTAANLSEDEVAKRAYILWLERGCPHGDSAQDWFTAIQQLETAK